MNKDFSNAERAQVLASALPYIDKYRGQTVVVKYGGNAMINEELRMQVMEDIVLLHMIGVRIVVVHGGGPEINDLMDRLGKKPEFIDGLRVTDKETMDIVQMVLSGKINKTLVGLIESKGGKAVGLSGLDGGLIRCRPKDPKLGYVGTVERINIKPVTDLLEKGYIPVISTIGCDKEGNTYNINGDTAVAHIAGALFAKRLIMLTDIAGVLKDRNDPDSIIRELTVSEAARLFEENVISGGMIPKVECCITALSLGVQKVIIMDGTVPHSLLMELLTDEGAGTMVVRGGK